MTTTLYFVRHCEFDNPQQIITSRLPGFPLSSQGKKTARLIAAYFKDKKIRAIYSSPILRAKQTAEIIGSAINLEIIINSLLIETKSPFQGKKIGSFEQVIGTEFFFEKEHLDGGGETPGEIVARVGKFTREMLRKNPGEEIIAVSHGDPITIYATTLIKRGFDRGWYRKIYVPKGGVLRLVFDDSGQFEEYSRVDY